MKILNLIQCTNLGGMEQASLRLMRGLKQRGETLRLLSLNPIGRLGPLLEGADIQHEGLSYLGKGGWRSYAFLKERLRMIQADAILMTGHHLLGSLALGDFCRGRRVLAIHYHHEGVKPDWQWRLIYRVACRRFDAITFPCDFIRKEAEAIYPPVACLAHTVRNPMEIPLLPTAAEKAEARNLLQLPIGRRIVGNAGWLIQRKRFDVFLRTARKILDRYPDILFAIAGDGSELENLRALAGQLGIASNIHWLGWQQEMSAFYKSLDVLLFNSDWDALGLTPLEAMSYGVPVVCSVANGGLGEVLDSDRIGSLLPSHDVEALSDRVLYLLNNPEKAAEIGLAGREHLRTVCRTEPIVDWYARALSGDVPKQQRSTNPAVSAKKSRAAILFHRVGPYHFARARAAGKRMETVLVEIFKSDDVYGWDPVPGADAFERVTLFEKNSQPASKLVPRIHAALDDCKPDVVAIPGWADAVAFGAIQWCRNRAVPVIVMSESTEWDEPRLLWKEWIKRRVLKSCAAGLVGGRPHADYLAKLGMPKDQIFQGYDVVDNDYFSQKAAEIKGQAMEIRRRHQLPESYFLASARFVDKKNLFHLVRAYARYRALATQRAESQKSRMGEIWDLVLLGDGPLRSEICGLIAELRLESSVLIPGFKQVHELPTYYALARAFVHGSTTEQWGLVVNEAMASGLPVLVSTRCGCARDLVKDGINGFVFDPHNFGQLAELMLRVSDFGFPLASFGRESRRIIAAWGPERFAAGLAQAVESALAAQRADSGRMDRVLLSLLSKK